MTTQIVPDPAGLKSWEEAFQYPLPTVQNLSVRLRKDIDDHRNRLRSLVGASYRDLLGTAERIIDMDTQIQTVESSLGDIGRRCNSRMLERGDANYTKLERSWGRRGGEEEQLESAARMRVLSAASAMVERLVKRGGNALQAAKLMLLSRLLYKSLESDDEEHSRLERHRRRISTLRNRLLIYVDRILSKPSLAADEVTNSLSAFALLSSSKLQDVLGHFLAVRIAQLETLSSSPTPDVTLQVLTLYVDTIQLVQTIFPKRIADRLSNLGTTPLLSDKDIAQAAELNLDIYGRWIAEDIWSFRPWVQQDAFPRKEAREDLTKFSANARGVLLSTLKQCLQGLDDATEVLSIRKQVLGAYLSLGSQTKIDGLLEHAEELRTAFTQHMELLATKTAAIEDFVLKDVNTITNQTPPPRISLWSLADNEFDLSSGGINLRRSVLRLRQGHDSHFDAVTAPLQRWHDRIRVLTQALEQMRSIRWDEYFDVDFDEGEEEIGKVFQSKFAVEDPAKVEQHLREYVEKSLTRTMTIFEQATGSKSEDHGPDFLLRVVREFNRHEQLIRGLVRSSRPPIITHNSLIDTLHHSLAQLVSEKSLHAFEQSLVTKQYIAADLWDGTPSLPLQPLPSVFRFALALQRDMSSYNEDVWSIAAVGKLKSHVVGKLAQALLQEPLHNSETDQVVGDDPSRPTNGGSRSQRDQTPAGQADQTPTAVEDSTQPEKNSSEGPEKSTQAEAEPSEAAQESTQAQEQAKVEKSADDVAEVESAGQAMLHKQRIQRLFDAMYLKYIFASNEKTGKFTDTLAQLKSRSELEKDDLQRLEKNASEYWRRSYLLFGLLAPSSTSVVGKR